MKQKQRFISFLLAWLMVATFGYAIALPQLQDDKKKTHTSTAQPVQLDEDTIPDSLLHTRWQIQRTQPYSLSDLYQSPLDLKRPDNLQYQVVYNDTLDRYIISPQLPCRGLLLVFLSDFTKSACLVSLRSDANSPT